MKSQLVIWVYVHFLLRIQYINIWNAIINEYEMIIITPLVIYLAIETHQNKTHHL